MEEIRYNVTGARRKELVNAIARITGEDAKYTGAPKFAYEIGDYTVTKDGTLEVPDDSEETGKVLSGIAEAGFERETDTDQIAGTEGRANTDETDGTEERSGTDEADSAEERAGTDKAAGSRPEEDDADEPIGLTVSMPLDKVNVGNLTRLLEAKGSLIKKALGIDALPIKIEEDAVFFPWFRELPDTDKVKACTHLIAALCKMSKDQKRITATAKDVENEKYTFRCFLLRLGFIGPEYKDERKILLQNLSGSAAFKEGGAGHEDAE